MPDVIEQIKLAIKDKTWMSESDFPLEIVQWQEGDADLTLLEEVQQFVNARDGVIEVLNIDDVFAGQEGLHDLQTALAYLCNPEAFRIPTEDAAKFDLLMVGWYGTTQVAGVRTTVVQT